MATIDLDTIKYPSVNPSLILSVSDSPYTEEVHVNSTQHLYVERYALSKYLSADVPPGHPEHIRFHLFTHELILKEGDETLGFGLPGGPGTPEHPNGGNGGEIILSVEDAMIDKTKLNKFKLDVSGGSGFNPTRVPGNATGADGGNGGDAGHIQIWLGEDGQEPEEPVAKMFTLVNEIHGIVAKTAKSKEWKWPDGFKADATFLEKLAALVTLSTDSKVIAVYTLAWKTPDDALAMSLANFKTTLSEIHMLFKPKKVTVAANDRLGLLERSTIWRRGSYGKGARGDTTDGKNGTDGVKDGIVMAKWITANTTVNKKTCFAHPSQCQMLLDKANVLYFLGTSRSIATSKQILEALEKRLQFLGGPQDSIADKMIAIAYESAEDQLFIHKTPSPESNEQDADWKKAQNKEPAAVRQLRIIRDEASRLSRQIGSGFDFHGPDGDIIPNLSFQTYEDNLTRFIEHATKAESSYSEYQQAENDADRKHAALTSASDATAKRKDTNDYYYKNARATVDENATKIEYLDNPLAQSRKDLEGVVDTVQKLIKDAFSVSLKDAVGAIGQVLFTPGKLAPAMAGLQAMDLFEDASTKIENDLGEKLKKSYVIKKVKKITGPTLKGLFDEFSTTADGKVTLKEGDETKLVVAEEELDGLIDSIAQKLDGGDEVVKTAKAKFEKYISLVKERNIAVVQYNAALALMRKCEKDRSTIEVANEGISVQLNDLNTVNPQLVLFMKRLYTDALTDAQLMVNRAQKALNFEFLTDFNAFEKVSDYSSSHPTAGVLDAAQKDLSKEYLRLKNDHRPRQAFTGIKYPLDELDVGGLTASSKGNIRFMKTINCKTGDPFEGKADVRLTKVRFFAKGAKTDSNQLEITLTHDTTETIYDETGAGHRFSHPKLRVTFSHHTETCAVGDSDGTIGEAKEADGYMLVGPFTSWWIDIRVSNNAGLSGDITEAWFEFDGEARAVVAS
ncbi:hypothetical protein FE257_010830 [Aspergillus nanangensis]|uniref:Uncharacterized protein n=1 Tax=Aspergillus nanangensis TaxID=2582783 RepID=A0AAD4GZC0_ASPNN|nr:hypothetical protein FE257_010830 [Aspergillus nanangensis]